MSLGVIPRARRRVSSGPRLRQSDASAALETGCCQHHGMALLTDDERSEFADSHPDWVIQDQSITRTFAFEDFIGAMAFVNATALLAEKAFHHPDIDIRWNKVTLTLSTHSEGGLTQKDIDLAGAIEVRM